MSDTKYCIFWMHADEAEKKYDLDDKDFYREKFESYISVNRSLNDAGKKNSISKVYIYIDTAIKAFAKFKSYPNDRDIRAALVKEERIVNFLKESIGEAFKTVYKDAIGGKPSDLPEFRFIGFKTISLLFSQMNQDKDIFRKFLAGKNGEFRYDAPKFTESILRIQYKNLDIPILRIDDDVAPTENAVIKLINKYDEFKHSPHFLSGYYIGPYKNEKFIDHYLNFPSIRLQWFFRKTNEKDYPVLTNLEIEIPLKGKIDNFLESFREIGAIQIGNDAQLISGAGAILHRELVKKLPPFMCFNENVSWIDDAVKKALIVSLGLINKPFIFFGSITERVDGATFIQDRHADSKLSKRNMDGAWNYFPNVYKGCLLFKVVADSNHLFVKEISEVIRNHPYTYDETKVKEELLKTFSVHSETVINLWSNDFSDTMIGEWASKPRYIDDDGKVQDYHLSKCQDALANDCIEYLKLLKIWSRVVSIMENMI